MINMKLKVYHVSFILLLFLRLIHAQYLIQDNILDKSFDDGMIALCPTINDYYDDQSNPVLLPYPNDCTKFYKCDWGVPIEQDCPEGLHWSVRTNRCEWPEIAQCQEFSNQVNSDNVTQASSPVHDSIVEEPTKPRYDDGGSSSDIFDNNFNFSHSSSYSDSDIFGDNSSPENSYDSTEDVVPNYSTGYNNTDSDIFGNYSNPESSYNSTQGYVPNYDNSSSIDGFDNHTLPMNNSLNYLCIDVENGELLPYPANCSKFIECSHNKAFQFDCPRGLVWNDNLKICDYGRCLDGNNYVFGNDTDFALNFTNSAELSVPNGPVPHPGCPQNEDPSNPTQLPFPGDCNKFYKCLGGYAYVLRCPPGLNWSVELNRCEWPGVANCTWGNEIMQIPLEPTETETESLQSLQDNNKPFKHPQCPLQEDPANPTHLPYPGDCTKFYKCDNGLAYTQNCPSGLYWNVDSNECDWPSNVQCGNHSHFFKFLLPKVIVHIDRPVNTSKCPLSEDPAHPTHLPYPNDCTKFYKCYNGLAYTMVCPPGEHWSVKLDRCEWPDVAQCDNSSILNNSSSNIPVLPPPSSQAPPMINVKECKNATNFDLVSYPNNCSKYIQCVNGFGFVLNCPAGLHFNTVLHVCDYPHAAGCKRE